MDYQNGETIPQSVFSENGKFGDDFAVVGEEFSVKHNAEILEISPKNGEGNALRKEEQAGSSNTIFFAPHPPENPKEISQRSPRKPKRFERRIHPQDSKKEDIQDKRTINPKLPPLRGKEDNNNDILPFDNEKKVSLDKNVNVKQTTTPLPLSLKPLAPIKDQTKLIKDFKSNQFQERERQTERDKAPLRPLKPNNDSPKMGSSEVEKRTSNVVEGFDKEVENFDGSDSTLTSVSSEGSCFSDSDDETSQSQGDNIVRTQYHPEPPTVPPSNHRQHHNSLSLTSVRDLEESIGRHSDSETMRRERREKRRSNKELWNKAKIVTLLPRVPASKARDRNSNFVQEELEKYLPEKKLMVFIGTWNMHGEKQLPIFLDDFLLPHCCRFMQDLYVVGTQESTPLRKEWEIKLQESLGPSHVMIYSCAFGVLHLAMYLRRELVWFCSAVEQATIATRPGHMIKTKGAVGLTLSIFGTSFLFINSHFTAHEHKWKERIADYRIIRKTLSLPLNYAETQNKTTDVTSRFHQVFWFGDFNFRVEERQGVVEKFLSQCEEDEDPSYDELIAKDQMTKLMSKDGVFEHFQESAINFAPTYRFDINPDNPGNYSSVRVPSWTDRIVYRSSDANSVKPLYYDCCTSLNISDHRPVYGIFETIIKPIKDRVTFTGVHFVRDVYIEANRRRATPPRNQHQTSVCTIL